MKFLNISGYEVFETTMERGDNCYVYDGAGNKYVDFESGVWALPLGHNNKRVNDAIMEQMTKLVHTGYRYTHPIVDTASEKLLEIMKLPGGRCIFLSSGSEAVEITVKMVRKMSNRPYLLKMNGNYLSAYGITGEVDSSEWISINWENGKSEQYYKDIISTIPSEDIAAFIFEPGNCSGTVKLPPKELVGGIAEKIQKAGGYLIVDEVTTGMGRTGEWFGYEHYGIHPDVIACGKGLGNGYPVSAVGISREFYEVLIKTNILYAQSHQNDPMGCAVVNAVIESIKDENLVERAARTGNYLKRRLEEMSDEIEGIQEVRGIGLMCAIQLDERVDSDMLFSIHRKLYHAGFIAGVKPIANVLRFYPPLTVEEWMIDEMVSALKGIIERYV